MKTNIGLIGFMGTGKTEVGRLLAASLSIPFHDTDQLIQEMTGKTIGEIFAESGEQVFRDIESKVVGEICDSNNNVISFGGGVILRKQNVDRIRDSCTVVLLNADPVTIHSRVISNDSRPLLQGSIMLDRIRRMHQEREALYSKAMDIEIDTDNKSASEIVSQIRGELGL